MKNICCGGVTKNTLAYASNLLCMQKNVTVETIAAYHARFESVDTHGHVGEMMGQIVLHHKTSL